MWQHTTKSPRILEKDHLATLDKTPSSSKTDDVDTGLHRRSKSVPAKLVGSTALRKSKSERKSLMVCCAVVALLRPWSNDQTLLVEHLRFGNQAKCWTVWPHRKTLLAKHFWLYTSECFQIFSKTLLKELCLSMFCDVTSLSNIAYKVIIQCLTNNI